MIRAWLIREPAVGGTLIPCHLKPSLRVHLYNRLVVCLAISLLQSTIRYLMPACTHDVVWLYLCGYFIKQNTSMLSHTYSHQKNETTRVQNIHFMVIITGKYIKIYEITIILISHLK